MARRCRDLTSVDGVWRWVGDGSDELDSMSVGMSVLIRAEDLRALEQAALKAGRAKERERLKRMSGHLEAALKDILDS